MFPQGSRWGCVRPAGPRPWWAERLLLVPRGVASTESHSADASPLMLMLALMLMLVPSEHSLRQEPAVPPDKGLAECESAQVGIAPLMLMLALMLPLTSTLNPRP